MNERLNDHDQVGRAQELAYKSRVDFGWAVGLAAGLGYMGDGRTVV